MRNRSLLAALALSTLSVQALAQQSREAEQRAKPKRQTKAEKKAEKRARTRGVAPIDGGQQ